MFGGRIHVTPKSPPLLEWGVAGRAMDGEKSSGDAHVVTFDEDSVLVAVVDGLGHGSEAAQAARRAAGVIERSASKAVIPLVRECHQALIGSRGVAMSLARFSYTDETMSWLAIGNVEGMLVRGDPAVVPAREAIVMRGGVVGYELPMLRAAMITVSKGDLLAFATDGIDAAFADHLSPSRPLQKQADDILATYGKRSDDALVLVARYLGKPGAP